MSTPNDATSTPTWFTVCERMHAVSAAYEVALPRVQDAKLRGQLQNFADESQQHLTLLQQNLSEQQDEAQLTHTTRTVAAQTLAWFDARQVQLGAALGVTDLCKALAEREQALVTALQALRQVAGADAERQALMDDQASCAKARARWLADPRHANERSGSRTEAGVTDEGRRDVLVNTPKAASAENSDC